MNVHVHFECYIIMAYFMKPNIQSAILDIALIFRLMSILGHVECNKIKLISWKVAPHVTICITVAYFSFSINTKKGNTAFHEIENSFKCGLFS